MTLYQKLVAAGIQTDSHCSDLYTVATPEALKIVKESDARFSFFQSAIDGKLWVEIPFAYDPFWEAARNKS